MYMKIRLAFFEDKFGVGGIEKFILNVCSNLDLNKYEVTLIVVNKITNQYDKILKELDIKVVELIDYIEVNPIKRFKKGVPLFNEFTKKYKPDIIHFNLSDSVDLLYVQSAKKNGIKIRIAHSHNSSVNSLNKKVAHGILKIFLQYSPNYYFACSAKAAKWLFPKDIYKKGKYELIHNAIYLNKFKYDRKIRESVRKKLNWDNKVIYGNVGRFNLQKNHKFLIDIFYNINLKVTNSELVLIGDGELKNEIEQYAIEKGLKDKVIFLGNSNKVSSLLQAMDLFLLPSLYEGLPFVLVESQAASLPAVVSDVVTKEVKCTEYIKYMSLQEKAENWCDMAIEMSGMDRYDTEEQLRNAGFSVCDMIKKLDKLYTQLYEVENGK